MPDEKGYGNRGCFSFTLGFKHDIVLREIEEVFMVGKSNIYFLLFCPFKKSNLIMTVSV